MTAKSTPKPRGPGRPSLSDSEDTVALTARVLRRQREKFNAMGGAEWLRGAIDRARVPSKNPK